MPQELELRGDAVTCSAAITYVELAAFLERNGAALHNLTVALPSSSDAIAVRFGLRIVTTAGRSRGS